jgi:short-subunit dehydrogenase
MNTQANDSVEPQAITSIDPSPWALVTGASAGIGAEFARQLAADGYHLVLTARRADRLHSLAAELKSSHGTACLVIPADLSDPRAGKDIAARLKKKEIPVEFLVNNAGYGVPGRFTGPDWQTHADFIQVMMTAVCDLTWRLLPAMQERGKGYVVNIASLAGLIPGSEGHTLYGASKSFLIRFSESLALENQTTGVNVSALCPGFTYSEFHDVTGTREQVSKMPAFMWKSADEVVRFGIESVRRNPPVVMAVPGFSNRLIAAMSRHLPWLARRMTKRMSRRFRSLESR